MTEPNPTTIETTSPTTTTPESALWRIVVSEYEQANARFEANWKAHEEAEAALDAECPLRHDFYDMGLRTYMDRDEALEAVDHFLTAREGVPPTEEGIAEQADRALAVVNDFFAHQRARAEAEEKHRAKELHDAHFAYLREVYDPARERLLATPAPDIAGLLLKAQVLAVMVDEGEGLEADIIRLFGSK